MSGIAETVKPALWFPGRNDAANVRDLWRGNVAHYPLWGGAGTRAMDLSGNGNDGTLTNMDPPTDWVHDTEVGMALDFDGANDFIDCAASEGATTGLTALVLFAHRTASLDNNEGLVSRHEGAVGADRAWVLGLDVAGMLIGALSSDGTYQAANDISGATAIGAGEWHVGVLTYQAGIGSKLYLDGVEDGANAVAPASLHAGFHVQIGTQFDETNPDLMWNGHIALAIIWNHALSAGAVEFLYKNRFIMIRQPDFTPFWDLVSVVPPLPVVTGAAPGITIADDTIGLSTVIPNPGISISDLNPTVIVEQ